MHGSVSRPNEKEFRKFNLNIIADAEFSEVLAPWLPVLILNLKSLYALHLRACEILFSTEETGGNATHRGHTVNFQHENIPIYL